MSRTLAADFSAEKDRTWARPFLSAVFHFGGSVGDVFVADLDITIAGNAHKGIVSRWGEFQSVIRPRDGSFQLGSMQIELTNFPVFGSPAKRFSDLWSGLGIEAIEVDLYQNFLAVSDPSKIMQDLLHVFIMRPIDYSPEAARVELVSVSEKYLDKKEISFPIGKNDFPAADLDALNARASVIYGSVKGVRAQPVAAYPASVLRAAINASDTNIPIHREFYDILSVAGSRLVMSASHLVTLVNSADASSYNTASIMPGANKLILAWIVNTHGSSATLPTLSGNGLTWVQVDTQLFSGNTARLTLFRAMGASPSAGAVTVDFGGVTQTAAGWSIIEINNADRSGTNGAGAIVQVAKNTAAGAAALTVNTAAFDYEENWTFGGIATQTNTTVTAGAGFTELGSDAAAGAARIESQYKKEADTSVDWTLGAAVDSAGIAVEIRAAEVGAIQIGAEKITFTSKVANAVTSNHLTTEQQFANQTSYSSVSISPAANKLILAWVESSSSGTPPVPTVTGNGLTWVQVDSLLFGVTNLRLSLFRAMGAAPTAGAVTFDFGGATQTGCGFSIVEFGEVDTGGTNGSAAVIQAVHDKNAAGPFTITMAAFASQNNATAAGYSKDTTGAFTAGSGFTILGQASNNNPDARTMSQWKDEADTTVDMSFSGIAFVAGIAVEIKAVGAPALAGATRGVDGTAADAHAIGERIIYFPQSITYLAAGHALKAIDAIYLRRGGKNIPLPASRALVDLNNTTLVSGKTLSLIKFKAPPLTAERWYEQAGSFDAGTNVISFGEQQRPKSSGSFEYTIEYEVDTDTAGSAEKITLSRSGGPSNAIEVLVMDTTPTTILRFESPLIFYDSIYYSGNTGNQITINHTGITITVSSCKVRYLVRTRLDDPLPGESGRSLTHRQYAQALSFNLNLGSTSGSALVTFGAQEHPKITGKFKYQINWQSYGDKVSTEAFLKRHLTASTESRILIFDRDSNGGAIKSVNPITWECDHWHNADDTRRCEFVVRKKGGGTFASGGQVNWLIATVDYEILNTAIAVDVEHLLPDSSADRIIDGDLLFDCQGYADDGSGTYTGAANALIEKPADILHHLARIVGGLPSARVDATSFATARADSPISYRFAGVVTERTFMLKEVLLALGMQSRVKPDFAIDKLSARFLKSAYGAVSKTIKAENVERESLRVRHSPVEEIINKIDLRYGRRWSEPRGESAFRGLAAASDSTSVTKYGERKQTERFLFDFVPDDNEAMAIDLASFWLARLKEPARIIELRAYLDQYELLVGDLCALDYLVGETEKFDGLDGRQKFLAEEIAHVAGAPASGEMRLMRLIFREVS